MLDERKSAILEALVEEHIRTAAPVSSHAILESSGLAVSSATIRNELVKLEREGYVSQPHTSAGRVPTDKAFRYHVDHIRPGRLRARTQHRIDAFFTGVHSELSALLQDTSDLLADLTNYPAVVLGPGLRDDIVHGVNLVRLGPRLVMVVLVSASGRVSKELCRLARNAGETDISAAERLVNEAFAGRPLPEAVAALEDQASKREVSSLVHEVAVAAERSQSSIQELYLGGTSQLASLWADLEKVHRILEFLEHQSSVQKLLDDTEGTTVRIGSELPMADQVDLAVVATSYGPPGSGTGRVGVLGPKRMDYRRTIKVVEEVSEGLGDSLGG